MHRFGVLDIYFSAPVGRSRVFAEIRNVTKVDYAELDVSEPEPGRLIFVGMTASF